MPTKAKGGKKQRKFGRNSDYCKTYAMAGVEEKNRKRKMRFHLRRNPGDLQAVNRFEQTFGKVADIGLVSRGYDLARRYQIRKMAQAPKNLPS